MIDKILLGFLMEGKKTGYTIKKYMENSTDFFFNTSFGSIYPALKKLEKEGLVTVAESIKNGKLNKSYTITKTGQDIFLKWLEKDPQITRIRDEALLKVFFYSHLKPEKIEEQLTDYMHKLEQQILDLQKVKDTFSDDSLNAWKQYTLIFGIDYYQFVLDCYQKMLKSSGRPVSE